MPPRKIYARMQEVRSHRIYQDSVKIPNALQFDIRDCIRDIYGLSDDMITETTTDDQ